jgi:dethiobiotin synthetase
MTKSLFITGTDTEAGKTVLTTALAAYFLKYIPQKTLGIMKPLQSGVGDREWYEKLFSLGLSSEEITPQYFQAPLAPPLAADAENRPVDLAIVWKTYQKLYKTKDFLLVEALGGLGSPVTHELSVADIAGQWRLPTVLVVPVKLGAISQAVTSASLARECKVNLKGIILNCTRPLTEEEIAKWAPVDMIQSFTKIPVLGSLPYLDNPQDLDKLAHIASNLNLENLWKI